MVRPPAPQLFPGQGQAAVPAACLVPDISFTFWFFLMLIKMCNYYISLTISRFYSKIHFFSGFLTLFLSEASVDRCFPCTHWVHADLRGRLPCWIGDSTVAASLPRSCEPTWGEGYEMMGGYSSSYHEHRRASGKGQPHCTWARWDTAERPSISLRQAFEMSSSATLLDMVLILKTICLASLHHMFKSSEFDSKYQNKCFL